MHITIIACQNIRIWQQSPLFLDRLPIYNMSMSTVGDEKKGNGLTRRWYTFIGEQEPENLPPPFFLTLVGIGSGFRLQCTHLFWSDSIGGMPRQDLANQLSWKCCMGVQKLFCFKDLPTPFAIWGCFVVPVQMLSNSSQLWLRRCLINWGRLYFTRAIVSQFVSAQTRWS